MSEDTAKLADPTMFEEEWIGLAEEVVRRVFADPSIQKIKDKFRTEGSLSSADRSAFITTMNRIKYEVILGKYGPENSDRFTEFRKHWENWLKTRGVTRNKAENLFEENIDHLLYGSTPDPEKFLREFHI